MSDAPELPDLNDDKPIYYFAGGFGDGLEPTLEVVKSWPEGQQSLALGTYDTLEDAFEAERELVALKENEGLEPAMHRAERMAVAERTLDPARPDGRLFTEGPPDPFTTLREAEIAGLDYTYEVVAQPQGLYELQSIKTWQTETGFGMQEVALGEYDRPGDARVEGEMLRRIRDEQGLEAEMREVEKIAVENGEFRADRVDPRLFTQGPPDPFTTTRQAELEASMGYTFRAGPALDMEDTIQAHSLDLVSVERDGADYHFTAAEFVRVTPADAAYVADAADKFNQMLADEGTGPTIQAATVWARGHGAEPSHDWHTVDAEWLERPAAPLPSPPSRAPDIEETEPLPAAARDLDI